MNSAPTPGATLYQVDDLTVDAGRLRVARGDTEIALPQLSFDLLLALVRAAPNLLTYEQLMEQVWPGIVVNQETISQRVKLVRDALGDNPQKPRYILGVRSRGYRLLAQAIVLPGPPTPSAADMRTAAPVEETAQPVPASPAIVPVRRWPFLALAAVVALAIVAIAFFVWREKSTPPSVAVLPFVNISSESDNEPFADGLSEEVLNVLAGIKGLKVAGRSSSFYFKGKTEKPEVIAATLGVNHLLEGSVRWAGPKVRITAQLIDATTGFHLWSETFEREITDVFAVQEEIARSVADALRIRLLPADEARLARRGTQSAEAHLLYLVARGRMRDRGLANLHVAKALFDRAIERDPQYANAFSGLADVYYLLISNHGEGDEEQGSSAAKRALELDPTSSEAYVSRANFAALRYDSHGEVADRELALAYYKRAIELDPSNAQAYHWYGATVMERDPDRALYFLERAIELDPLLRPAQLAVAELYDTRGQYEKARGQMNEVIDRYPDFATAYYDLGRLEYSYGHVGDARMRYRQAYELEAEPEVAMAVYFTSVTLGDKAAAAEWLPRFAGSSYSEMMAKAVRLSIEGKYLLALEPFERGLEVIESPERIIRIVIRLSHLELIVGHPERAIIMLLKQYPELARDETPITLLNCDAAIALATSWQRTKQRQAGDRLLRRTAAWLDGPAAPRAPQARFVRAQVHALLGERDQAFDALDRAYDGGYRSTLGSSLNFFFHTYWGEDTPMLEGIRGDPRFSAWFARIHADNSRQLALQQSPRASNH
jgi:TolB-like protein/DNA-binding winged helix-turn-helix (wHTH) protein/Tfp pilus assembly protein PilF